MSDAKMIAQERLAKGEITPEEYLGILKLISDGDVLLDQKPIDEEKIENKKSSSPTIEESSSKAKSSENPFIYAAISVMSFLWLFLLYNSRATIVAECQADPRMIPETCGTFLKPQGAILLFCLWGVAISTGAVAYIKFQNKSKM
jgi:hypothetical protein